MSRSIHRLLSSSAALAVLLAFGVLAAGCAGTPAALSDIRYDFGPPSPAASAGTLPAVKVLDVSAPDGARVRQADLPAELRRRAADGVVREQPLDHDACRSC